jgi:hypothetical protein
MEALKSSKHPTLFNSEVETAIRTLILLDAVYPRRCNIAELTWFDHVVVNTGDFPGAPPSLHPKTPVVTGELLVRRHSISDGLRILRLLHLAEESHDDAGICYSSGEEAPAIIEMLSAPYHNELKIRAHWVAQRFGHLNTEQIETEVSQTIGRWATELQSASFPIGSTI